MRKVVQNPSPGRLGAYGSSKLCNVLFAQKLQEIEDSAGSGVCACSLHPGAMIGTEIAREGNVIVRYAFRFMSLFTKSVDQGCATAVFCTVCPPRHIGGQYFDCCRPKAASKYATHAAADVLWEISEELVVHFAPTDIKD